MSELLLWPDCILTYSLVQSVSLFYGYFSLQPLFVFHSSIRISQATSSKEVIFSEISDIKESFSSDYKLFCEFQYHQHIA